MEDDDKENILKLLFHSKLFNFRKSKLTYIIINGLYEGIGVEFERKWQHNIGFPTFKLPSSTNNILRLTR